MELDEICALSLLSDVHATHDWAIPGSIRNAMERIRKRGWVNTRRTDGHDWHKLSPAGKKAVEEL